MASAKSLRASFDTSSPSLLPAHSTQLVLVLPKRHIRLTSASAGILWQPGWNSPGREAARPHGSRAEQVLDASRCLGVGRRGQVEEVLPRPQLWVPALCRSATSNRRRRAGVGVGARKPGTEDPRELAGFASRAALRQRRGSPVGPGSPACFMDDAGMVGTAACGHALCPGRGDLGGRESL